MLAAIYTLLGSRHNEGIGKKGSPGPKTGALYFRSVRSAWESRSSLAVGRLATAGDGASAETNQTGAEKEQARGFRGGGRAARRRRVKASAGSLRVELVAVSKLDRATRQVVERLDVRVIERGGEVGRGEARCGEGQDC